MPFIPRAESLRRLAAVVKSGRPIIGAGAGTGISAKFSEKGGVDLIIIYNSGRYRMAGRGSLAGMLVNYSLARVFVFKNSNNPELQETAREAVMKIWERRQPL